MKDRMSNSEKEFYLKNMIIFPKQDLAYLDNYFADFLSFNGMILF